MDLNTKTSNSELEYMYFVLHADILDVVSKLIKDEKKDTAKFRTYA